MNTFSFVSSMIGSSLRTLCSIYLCLFSMQLGAQCLPGHTDSLPGLRQFSNPAFGNFLSIKKDRLGRAMVYCATKDGGLKIFDVGTGVPFLLQQFPVSMFRQSDVINIQQINEHLYVCLGDIWNNHEASGLAVFDVEHATDIRLLDTLFFPPFPGGVSTLFIDHEMAYLATMQHGMLIVDVDDKTDLKFISQLTFGNDFPHKDSSNALAYNARGIWVQGNYAYVCYDRGGLRIVDVRDPHMPKEVGRYCFEALVDSATAYNHLWIHQNLAYLAIDYAGLEILDITDPMHPKHVSWWHPDTWANPTNNFNRWSNSRGHANEIVYDESCQRIYLAAGNTDAVSIDVSNPLQPTTCTLYELNAEHYGSWGLDFHRDVLYLAYIWSPFFPPYSNYTGFCMYQTKDCKSTNLKAIDDLNDMITLQLIGDALHIHSKLNGVNIALDIGNTSGKMYHAQLRENQNPFRLDVSQWPSGLYWCQLTAGRKTAVKCFVKFP